MSLSIYVHIPYCIQRCYYCDFTTFEANKILPPEDYFQYLHAEFDSRKAGLQAQPLRSLYFGGGTPSLVPPELIVTLIKRFASAGFEIDQSTEVTIEINPGTLTRDSLDTYMKAGINRFSVGAQTFQNRHLKACGREHSAEQTRSVLKLLKSAGVNYTFDLLYGLPKQSLAELREDLDEIVSFSPKHLSAYLLTVPKGHIMNQNRPSDDWQIQMMDEIESALSQIGLFRYEISNYAVPGYESKHNLSYWHDLDFWGLGLSAHSYLKSGDQSIRFWNPTSMKLYAEQVKSPHSQRPFDSLPDQQKEFLKPHEIMTDLCHMHLRTEQGLPGARVAILQQNSPKSDLEARLSQLETEGFLDFEAGHWSLTREGRLLSNKIFERLTFLEADCR